MELEEFDIEFLAQKMSEVPRSPLFARLADLYLTKAQNDEAMKLLEEGIPLFPNYYAAYIVLGKAHLVFKEYSKAITAFSKALELSPFNQTAALLLTTVPNKPDESTRTTDETYFSPAQSVAAPAVIAQPAPFEEQQFQSVEQPAAEPEPIPFETPSVEELGFTQDVELPQATIYEEPVAQHAEPTQEQYYSEPQEAFPTYDEYFAQNQSKINNDSPMKLDDYLSGSIAPAETTAVVDEMPQHEFVNESYVELEKTDQTVFEPPVAEPETPSPFEQPAAEPEAHVDAEPVFASPEQARLFAELTGIETEPEVTKSSGTDLDSLTEKLQNAEKIVPEENYQPKTPTPQETQEQQAYETDAVTPTLAEIYASQGEYRAAIQAYEILMFSQPQKGGDFQKRIRELQQKQMEKDGLI
ncbi:MAG: tetratricopeptide repeat protein [Bacteroidota bacterium]|jgi:tetratricopeptide (TPR) repeat protein